VNPAIILYQVRGYLLAMEDITAFRPVQNYVLLSDRHVNNLPKVTAQRCPAGSPNPRPLDLRMLRGRFI